MTQPEIDFIINQTLLSLDTLITLQVNEEITIEFTRCKKNTVGHHVSYYQFMMFYLTEPHYRRPKVESTASGLLEQFDQKIQFSIDYN